MDTTPLADFISPALIIQEDGAAALAQSLADRRQTEGRGEGVRVRAEGAVPTHLVCRELARAFISLFRKLLVLQGWLRTLFILLFLWGRRWARVAPVGSAWGDAADGRAFGRDVTEGLLVLPLDARVGHPGEDEGGAEGLVFLQVHTEVTWKRTQSENLKNWQTLSWLAGFMLLARVRVCRG